MCLIIRIYRCLASNETNTSNFQLLEVVDRGSETQPQVIKYLNKLPQQDKGYWIYSFSLILVLYKINLMVHNIMHHALLKGLAQAKIIKKSVILFWLLNMII